MPKVSVILPIYNAEPYLRQCLDSIRHQKFSDIEVLCMNDGSTDSSLSIMREYESEDSRFRVIDKPNGGYGNTLNFGLTQASGDYVSIVEPDDFIDENMYGDLVFFASEIKNGADIVKGSYWEYYDGRDGFDEFLRVPNLSSHMKNEPFLFSLEQDCEVFCHHPSIWSAIYKRSFLLENEIIFVEPKGAGWADNPFFLQTLVLAKSIVWVPKKYYFYRQTNASSSSFLKDYNIPFDRLREMRALLHEYQVSSDVWAAFYLREFDYIYSTIGEFGFSEGEPEIIALINEVLMDMNPDIVRTNIRLRPRDIHYYDSFLKMMDADRDADLAGSADSVTKDSSLIDLSVIMPVKDNALSIGRCIESLLRLKNVSLELLCVDCGSTDRSMRICNAISLRDNRVKIGPADSDVFFKSIEEAVEHSAGLSLLFCSPECVVVPESFGRVFSKFKDGGFDALIFGSSSDVAVDLMKKLNCHGMLQEAGCSSNEAVIGAFSPGDVSDYLFTLADVQTLFFLVDSKCVRGLGVCFDIDECVTGLSFRCSILKNVHSLAYTIAAVFTREFIEATPRPSILDLHDQSLDNEMLFPLALRAVSVFSDYDLDRYRIAIANLYIVCLMRDLRMLPYLDEMKEYYEKNNPFIEGIIGKGGIGKKCCDCDAYRDYQLLKVKGFEYYLDCKGRDYESDLRLMRARHSALEASLTLRLGRSINSVVQRFLPKSFVGRIRSSIASSTKKLR